MLALLPNPFLLLLLLLFLLFLFLFLSLCFSRFQAVDFLFLLDQTILQADKMKRRMRDEGHGMSLMDVVAAAAAHSRSCEGKSSYTSRLPAYR
ncbi:uncharacterized protein LY79DRAFT_564204 [Colletotrichum navitas]|uniref:Uncharacterized protein n=1 Tax=Colletotrichum navitas TaxID=681940 RepID=A0AAD8V274_9PEZI|nr:uncharacterized protein LY79DRAFT_564204 [Colletotrichum navitas]KAK1579458.1 hypothetical protein LY79DRAFT_564204 [Colletotrichum navitas]